MAEVFLLQMDEYDTFLEEQTYFDDNSVVTVPTVGVYQGPENIIEYFLVQNPFYTNFRHYIDPLVVADITLMDASETVVEFYYKATAENFFTSTGSPSQSWRRTSRLRFLTGMMPLSTISPSSFWIETSWLLRTRLVQTLNCARISNRLVSVRMRNSET